MLGTIAGKIAQIVADWTLNKTIRRANEELCELQLALMHYSRGKVTLGELLEEIADAKIVIWHLEQKYGSVNSLVHSKLDRELKRMAKVRGENT